MLTIREVIALSRKRAGLTQAELAEQLTAIKREMLGPDTRPVTGIHISRWEHGVSPGDLSRAVLSRWLEKSQLDE